MSFKTITLVFVIFHNPIMFYHVKEKVDLEPDLHGF